MHRQRHTFIPLPLALALSIAGCSSTDIGSDVLEARNCPGGECDPPDDPPEEDPPPDDPPPPQPDPAKYREKFIPVAYVQSKLDTFLGGTAVQVSHLGGPQRSFFYVGEECETHSNPDVLECVAECNSATDLTPAQRAQCRNACYDSTTTCHDVCRSWQTTNWLRWGPIARAASILSSPKACNASTCPACNPPQMVPSLEDRPLPVPIFDEEYSLPPFTYHITCRLNLWVFQIGGNISATASPAGLVLGVPGVTGDPAIPCDNAPDVEVDDLGLQVKFVFPSYGLNIAAEGTLVGDWDVFGEPIDFLADINGRISSAVRDASRDVLNTPAARAAYRDAFFTLIDQFVDEVTHEQLDILGNVQATNGGLNVRYWVQ